MRKPDSQPDAAPNDILKTAYDLKSAEQARKLYRDWARTYDQDFAEAYDYRNPQLIAALFAAQAIENTPVLDVGAGTGLVGQALAAQGQGPIDALDFSPEMLAVAMEKGCYRAAIEGDLTGRLKIADDSYGGVICVGTFTHGHVGPQAIDELIRVARPGALFTLGVNADIYESAGFAAKFAAVGPLIRDFEIVEQCGYGPSASPEQRAARTAVAVFRKR